MTCPNCHKETKTGVKFCPYCGFKQPPSDIPGTMTAETDRPAERKKNPQPKKKLPLKVILLTLCLLLAGFIVFKAVKNSIDKNKVTQNMLDSFASQLQACEQQIASYLEARIKEKADTTWHGLEYYSKKSVDDEMEENRILRNHITIPRLEDLQARRGWAKVENAEDYESLYEAYQKIYAFYDEYRKNITEEPPSEYENLKKTFDRCYKRVAP